MQSCQTQSRYRGIGRYSLSLAQAIARLAGSHEVFVALNGLLQETIEPLRAAFDGLIPQERIVVWQTPGPVAASDPENVWRTDAAEFVRESFLASLQPDVVHLSSLFEGWVDDGVTSVGAFERHIATAVTLYDLIPLADKGTYLADSGQRKWYYAKLKSLKRAQLLLAISDYSWHEAAALLGLPESRSVCISGAADPMFRALSLGDECTREIRHRYGLNRAFVMCAPGGFDPRKNVEGLIHAYSRLPGPIRARYRLVIVSRIDSHTRQHLTAVAQEAGLADDELVLTGLVPDADLVVLYNLCDLFVLPSRSEGFGLPALEAMSCGAAVIGADATSMPEVIGWGDALFDPRSIEDMSERMHRALTDSQFHAALIDHGRLHATRFSWESSAKRALEAMERMHEDNLRTRGSSSGETAQTRLRRLANAIARIEPPPPAGTQEWLRLAAAIADNGTAEDGSRRLLVDVSELAVRDAQSGIQRVVRAILLELVAHPPQGYRTELVYCDAVGRYRYARRLLGSIQGNANPAAEDDPMQALAGDTFLGLDLAAHIVPVYEVLFQRLRDRGIKVYFVVYDLLPVQRPDDFPGMDGLFGRWLHFVVAVADGAICISRAVADELLTWIASSDVHRPRDFNVGYFHLGADIPASRPDAVAQTESSPAVSNLPAGPSLLMVGTIEPRKGYAQALAAFETLWVRGVQINLAIVGRQGWKVDSLAARLRAHPEAGKRLVWFEGASDEVLLGLYSSAAALLAASEGEGFGLPLVEAAKHGLPIIARDIPVFREVAGNHAFYFRGQTAEELADAIEEWLGLREDERIPTTTDMPWLTWSQSAGQLLAVINNGNWYTHWPQRGREVAG